MLFGRFSSHLFLYNFLFCFVLNGALLRFFDINNRVINTRLENDSRKIYLYRKLMTRKIFLERLDQLIHKCEKRMSILFKLMMSNLLSI
jgi:hypothetical protein